METAYTEVKLEQTDIVIDGVCAKQIVLPKDHSACKHTHDYDHISILAKGVVSVFVDDQEEQIITAPAIMKIEAGKEHSVYAIEDAMWYCIHNGKHSDEVVGV